jgi:large subunit ribosomal protein L25
MSKHFQMTATIRERAGKGNARATRREGLVPAVIYGDNKPPVMISLQKINVVKALHSGQFFTHLTDIELDGQKHLVLARDVQLHPVKDFPDHVDFLRVSEKTMITVEVPVEFINEDKCAAIKAGGVLTIIAHTVELKCRADQIPEQIIIDLATADTSEAIKIGDLKLPAGVKAVGDENEPVATIAEASEEGELADTKAPIEVVATAQKAPEAAAGSGSTKDVKKKK